MARAVEGEWKRVEADLLNVFDGMVLFGESEKKFERIGRGV